MVGVLILVHQYVLEPPAVVLQHRRHADEQLQRLEQQIVEVQRVVVAQALLVEAVDVRNLLHAEVLLALGEVFVRREHVHLRVADLGLHLARRVDLVRQVELLEHVLDDGHLVLVVVDGEVVGIAQLLDVAAQYAAAGGVEGGHPQLGRPVAHQLFDALAHLAGGLVGEGDGQYVVGIDGLLGKQRRAVLVQAAAQAIFQMRALLRRVGGVAFAVVGVSVAHHVGDALSQHRGLARARAGQHQQRPLYLKYRLALLGVESCILLLQQRAAKLLIVHAFVCSSFFAGSGCAPSCAFFSLMRSSALR